MRQSTIKHINERIAHANQQHGEFANTDHIIAQARVELDEAQIAHWHGAGDVVHELLDAAVVCIRGAEQFGGLEGTEYDPAEVALGNAVEPTDDSQWREKVKAAHDMVSALCKPRGSKGSREWIMSIHARPEYDPDLVITEGLRAAEKRIDYLESVKLAVEPTDEQVEALAQAMLEILKSNSRAVWVDLARAAYAHIGAEVAKLRAELEQARHQYEVERDRANDLLSELEQARAEANSATCAQQEHVVTIEGLIEKVGELDLALTKALAERQTRPVKVRFDVSGERALDEYYSFAGYPLASIEHIMSLLASRAVIDLPADVPSAEEITNEWANDGRGDFGAIAFALEHLSPWLQPRTEDPRIAVIREEVKPIPIADLVEHGTDAPQLLAQRIRRIREVLEGRDNG